MSSRLRSRTRPANSSRNPALTTRRGLASGEELRDPRGEQQQRQRQRQQPHAGLHRRDSQRDRQEQRHHEERPRLDEEHEQEREHPGAHLDVAQQLRVEQCSLAALDAQLLA
jgi:hypothetical protein